MEYRDEIAKSRGKIDEIMAEIDKLNSDASEESGSPAESKA